jgi:magnesium-transporting ATPase (P-type)
MTQAAIVAGQVANGFGCRTERESLFKVGIFSNKWIVLSEIFAVLLMAAISYVPFLQNILKTGPLSLNDWGFLAIATVTLFFAEEGRKWLLRRRTADQGG